MAKFRKKPVIVEAIHCSDALKLFNSNFKDLPDWLKNAYEEGNVIPTNEGIHISTLEGKMLAGPKDWIILGTKKEIYPCKPDIFEQIYEPV